MLNGVGNSSSLSPRDTFDTVEVWKQKISILSFIMSFMYDLGKMASYQYFQMLLTCESWESSDFLNFRITIGEYCCCERIDLNFTSWWNIVAVRKSV